MLSALLTGVNRAFPYAKGMKPLKDYKQNCFLEILKTHGRNESLLKYWRPWRSGGLLLYNS